jgi:hypothetical protein
MRVFVLSKKLNSRSYFRNIKMKKTFITLIIAFIISNVTLNAFGGGDGTAANPYQIHTREHLEALTDSMLNTNGWSKGKYFIVMNDITDPIKTPIGLENKHLVLSRFAVFEGDFNGNNKKITLAIQISNWYQYI